MGTVQTKLCKHPVRYIGALALLALGIGAAVGSRPWDDSGGHLNGTSFPGHGPAEFLYLDRARVVAYLAQMEGGKFSTETLTSKLSSKESAAISLENIGEIGGSTSQEDSLARDVTPTAAADYFELLKNLINRNEGLKTIGLARFNTEVEPLIEGQFISFRTHGLRPPVYLNPYLALRQPTTFASLFPAPTRSTLGTVRGRRQRARALHFRHQLGRNPRVVFALRPLDKKEIERRHRDESARPISAEELANHYEHVDSVADDPPGKRQLEAERMKVRKRRAEEEQHVLYLMPLNARLLTKERSLIKFGGGEFTVVGKVVRVFPEAGDGHSPAYVDSPTLETWEEPLVHAPLKLLCSTDPDCREDVQRSPGDREEAIDESRGRDLDALREQTEIPDRGAVILPIAIYK